MLLYINNVKGSGSLMTVPYKEKTNDGTLVNKCSLSRFWSGMNHLHKHKKYKHSHKYLPLLVGAYQNFYWLPLDYWLWSTLLTESPGEGALPNLCTRVCQRGLWNCTLSLAFFWKKTPFLLQFFGEKHDEKKHILSLAFLVKKVP